MTDSIKDMIKKLKRGNSDKKREAANALGEAAQKGHNIGAALEALRSALSDSNHHSGSGTGSGHFSLGPYDEKGPGRW